MFRNLTVEQQDQEPPWKFSQYFHTKIKIYHFYSLNFYCYRMMTYLIYANIGIYTINTVFTRLSDAYYYQSDFFKAPQFIETNRHLIEAPAARNVTEVLFYKLQQFNVIGLEIFFLLFYSVLSLNMFHEFPLQRQSNLHGQQAHNFSIPTIYKEGRPKKKEKAPHQKH